MEQPELLQYAIEALERLGITYMVVGSLASSVYGEPRSTLDIDIVIACAIPEQITIFMTRTAKANSVKTHIHERWRTFCA